MDMIIFGAGASYGSDATNVPPLTNMLYDQLAEFSRVWKELSPEFTALLHSDFEQGMLKISERKGHLLPELQRAMAEYFFKFIPSEDNLYVKLFRKLKENAWKGTPVSFNYDRLLETSLAISGWIPILGATPNIQDHIEWCIPHGCCNLFCESIRGNSRHVSFNGMGVTTNGPGRSIVDLEHFKERIRNDAFPPIMSYMEPKKRTTSGADFILFQRKRFRELAQSASKIVIIGLRVQTHDTHIWEPLAETNAELIYCSGSRSIAEFQTWVSQNRENKENKVLLGYFNENFDSICSELTVS